GERCGAACHHTVWVCGAWQAASDHFAPCFGARGGPYPTARRSRLDPLIFCDRLTHIHGGAAL
ncbi:MAG: hypothetical protein J0H99_19605, partial [Rhodospirillales bacterium]|nr:hypothetical protein [Rhodospirillales bacterium]